MAKLFDAIGKDFGVPKKSTWIDLRCEYEYQQIISLFVYNLTKFK